MTWSDRLKVALVAKDTNAISQLLDAMPEFTSLEEMQEAFYLLKQANTLLQTLKADTLTQMNQIKKNIDFLNSTQNNQKQNRLDISS